MVVWDGDIIYLHAVFERRETYFTQLVGVICHRLCSLQQVCVCVCVSNHTETAGLESSYLGSVQSMTVRNYEYL
jgi:hypothetical protein